MEGLIPLVYKAIVEYKNAGRATWINESPSASYMRLPGDSGRFETSDIQLFGHADTRFSTTSSSSPSATTVTKRMVSGGVQSPARCHRISARAVK
ncbi:PREDICTED: uncharacterized protein LOC109212984 [Nicotiana attenuata]|uniref:Uncharacterized protein n=1 Tax=Nicotiana attenuata TaxID=49451 RepID=A0A1J6LAX9_NICAT|nr:PREDICTED: uncharacterized protein LOC109212984 [Nicotiana attenuata]OIT28169.1 hypothetical protein A4A49_21531 [Nicotiana attenuata]